MTRVLLFCGCVVVFCVVIPISILLVSCAWILTMPFRFVSWAWSQTS